MDTAYGLQFHIEPDSGTWSAWREHLPAGLLEGKELKQHLIEQMGKTVTRNFFDVTLSDRDPLSSSQQTIEIG